MTRRVLRVGVDEAGLGPKLGPLGLAAFATEGPADLRAALADVIGEPGPASPRLEVGDSKKIHQGSRKLARLERTVLATVCWTHELDRLPKTTGALLRRVGFQNRSRQLGPWYSMLDEKLPLACDAAEVLETTQRLREAAARAGVVPRAYVLDLVPAYTFNRRIRAECDEPGGSKNTWVVARTLELVRRVFESVEPHDAIVRCDKAGGRDRYTPALARTFGDHAIASAVDGRRKSYYALESLFDRPPTFSIEWLVGGDREDPRISWASCLAKYAREATMRAFNRYWSGQVDPLAPTAGYPQDAKRFIAQVAKAADRLDLDPTRWIRER